MKLVVGQNSYITLEEANEIVSDEYLSSSNEYKIWAELSDDDKIKLIIKGTSKIENQAFLGIKINSWGMAWPRYLYNKEVDCPDDVKKAIMKNILTEQKYARTKEQQLQDLGVTSYKVKDASISFTTSGSGNNSNSKVNGIYKDIYDEYLSKWTY